MGKSEKKKNGKHVAAGESTVKKNEKVIVTIEDIGVNGEGIGRIDGYTLFVKDAVIGDTVEARITKAKKNYGYARLETVITPSAYRVPSPVCSISRKCGGCQIQDMIYERQLIFKQDKVRENLLRIGEVPEELLERVMEPIVGMEPGEGFGAPHHDRNRVQFSETDAESGKNAGAPHHDRNRVQFSETDAELEKGSGPYHYRNKAQFPIGTDREGNLVAGFYAGRTHSIIPNLDCPLGVEENGRILRIVLAFMKEYQIPAYDEVRHEGLVRHVLIRCGFRTGELMVCLVINGNRLPHGEILAERLQKIPGMTSITYCINREKTNVIMGDTVKLIWGKMYITDYIGDVKYQISPLSFYQVNLVQTEKLYKLVMEYSGLGEMSGEENGEKKADSVWDLYCGIGTISLFLARRAKKVYGVEIVPQAIEDARNNARINGIENAEFFVGKAEEVLPEFYRKSVEKDEQGVHADVIVVDPPRKGCDAALLETIAQMQPERVVYVSCDPATLARDVKFLRGHGYELERVRAADLFPNTVHVETICLLSKLNIEHHIEVELTMDETDLTTAESRATYEEIKNYVKEKTGLQVSNLYIAQIKRKCGIIERINYNLPKSENSRQPQCPPEKEAAIIDALKHFQMI